MAKYKFNLRKANSIKETPINLVIRYRNEKLVYSSGESIIPKNWSFSKQQARESKDFKEYPEFNERLDAIKGIAKRIFRNYLNENDQQYPTTTELRELLKVELSGNMILSKMSLFGFVEHYIEQSEKTKSRKTLQWHKLTLKRLREFAKNYERQVDFDTIDLDFYHDFCEFLTYDLDHSINTVGKHIQNLKAFLNEATDRGINSNLAFKSRKFKKVSEEVDNIYLTASELEEMYNIDLSSNLRLDRVRDLFIVGCWTGLRFGDFTNITKKNIKGDFLEIKTQKTGEIVVIPIHWTIKEILKKYKGKYTNSLPPAISNTKMNAYIKEVGVLIKSLHTKSSTSRTKGGVKRTVTTEKYKMVSSHTARRSMATNLFLSGFPSISIMKITGHKTESAFLKYIKVTPTENAELLQLHWQNNVKLRAV